ncbi:MAG: bifunctional nuclease family protein [Ktedonobacterales bacterium]|nr:bifunctional nuclease family protein [Ktedonobacterales bacterium]
MVEMAVDSIRFTRSQQRVVVLKDTHDDRYLLIWIGQSESAAIVHELQGASYPRPLTHDLLKAVITDMGGKVVHIVINELKQSTYYARIVIEIGGKTVEVDARPSDAIALAVRVKCPIYASEAVLKAAAVIPEELEGTRKGPAPRAMGEAEAANLDAYRDFINNLDILDEFGKD